MWLLLSQGSLQLMAALLKLAPRSYEAKCRLCDSGDFLSQDFRGAARPAMARSLFRCEPLLLCQSCQLLPCRAVLPGCNTSTTSSALRGCSCKLRQSSLGSNGLPVTALSLSLLPALLNVASLNFSAGVCAKSHVFGRNFVGPLVMSEWYGRPGVWRHENQSKRHEQA